MRCLKKKERALPNKKAILIGLNYPNSYYSLNGCVNDVIDGGKFLEKKGYQNTVLVDKDISETYNILEALNDLKNCNKKKLFFHYSGHGSQEIDTNGDEEDGYDEAVYSKNGKIITDDEINKVISEYSKDKSCVLMFDCCHSGSIVDLPYILTINSKGYTTEKVMKNVECKVICISGCKDPQTSSDVTENSVSYGALSKTFYSLLKKNEGKNITWRTLYIDLLYNMKNKGYSQIPVISASDPSIFDEIISL